MFKKHGVLILRGLVGIAVLSTIGFYAAVETAMWGGSPARNMVSDETGLPVEWDPESGMNIVWTAQLGSQAYGNPVVIGGKVFVGTNNQAERNPKLKGDRGVVMAFRESNGEFLWQAAHPKLASGRVNDWPLQGICSGPFVEGERIYYVSNRAEVI
ncbi:MAG: PQQ-binding-like beta-propeller repeat protein, partial [Anaerolineae bacterium]